MPLTLSLDSNPYGTPTSLSLISPHDHVLGDDRNISMIPDSPTSRGPRSISEAFEAAIDVHRESTKSESPELDSPIHDMALMDPASPAGEQVDGGIHDIQPEIPPDLPSSTVQTDRRSNSAASLTALVDAVSTPKPTLFQHPMDTSPVVDNESEQQQREHADNTSQPLFKRKTPSKDIILPDQAINGINGDIYDPIETDSESFQEKQRMHSTKRLKISNTIRGRVVSPWLPPSHGKERKDDGFVVPCLPASRYDGARVPLGANANPGDNSPSIQDNGQVLEIHPSSLATTAEESQGSENLSVTGEVAGQENAFVGRVTADMDVRSRTRSSPHASSPQEARRLAAEDLAVAETRQQARPKREDDEPGNSMPTTNGTQEMQTAEQKKTEETVIRERQTREKILAEEAEKIMLAADGARHLEAEKMEKKRVNGKPNKEVAAPTETSPKTPRYAETKSNEMLPLASNTYKNTFGETVGKGSASNIPPPKESRSHSMPGSSGAALTAHKVTKYKPRTEEQKARRLELASQKKVAEAKAAGGRNSRGGTTVREQDKPTLERSVQQFRALSEDRSCHSSTPSESTSIGGQKRKTMTPALPKSSVNTPSSNKVGILSSSPLAPKSLNGLETPLRSALKQGSSALRRSVSFVDDPEDHMSSSKAAIFFNPPSTHHNDEGNRPIETLTDINNELSFKTPTESKPLKPAMPLKGSGSKASKTNSAKKEKLQTKLNVTRRVAKGKERRHDAPVAREHPPPQVMQISPSDHDSVSSFSDEAVGPNGSSKAGPSSRMSRGRMESLRERTAVADGLPDSLIDPEFRTIAIGKGKASTAALASTSLPEQRSSTRSPALPLPKRTSPDFSLTSNSEEGPHGDSEYTSSSSLEESDSLSSADEVEIQNSNQSQDSFRGVRKAVSVEIRSPSITSRSQSSQIPFISSSKSRNLAQHDNTSRLVDQAAKEQLRSELNQSLPTPKSGNRATGEVSAQGKPVSKPDQKLNRHGRLPNGIRPANYRYPSLSELKRQSKADSIYDVPSTSQAPATTSVGRSAAASHSSEDESSEDESSDSEDDEAAANGQPKLKSTSGRIPGLNGLIKSK